MTTAKGRVVFPRQVRWLTTAATPREDWLQARRQGLGGSDVAAILGRSAWRTPMDVWLEKTGRSNGEPESERMRWGTLLEDTVAKEWASRDACSIMRLGTVADPVKPWRTASLDRAVLVPRTRRAASLLEVKTTGHTAADLTDLQLAARYQWQAQWYLGITGLEYAHIAVLVAGQELRDLTVQFSIDDWYEATDAADTFWHDHVLTDTPPPVSAGDHEGLNVWPAEQGAEVTAGPVLAELVELRRAVRAEADSLRADADLLDAAIKAHMGAATELVDAAGRTVATWRQQASTRVDTAALKDAGLYQEYSTRSVTRVLRIKEGRTA